MSLATFIAFSHFAALLSGDKNARVCMTPDDNPFLKGAVISVTWTQQGKALECKHALSMEDAQDAPNVVLRVLSWLAYRVAEKSGTKNLLEQHAPTLGDFERYLNCECCTQSAAAGSFDGDNSDQDL